MPFTYPSALEGRLDVSILHTRHAMLDLTTRINRAKATPLGPSGMISDVATEKQLAAIQLRGRLGQALPLLYAGP